MKYISNFLGITLRHKLLFVMVIVFAVTTSLNGTTFADSANPCPPDMSNIDCQAIINGWVNWVPDAVSCNPDQGGPESTLNGYGLPATQGKTGVEAAIDANGDVNDTTNPNNPDNGQPITFAATLRSLSLAKRQPYQDYYITMRWNYSFWNWDGTATKPQADEFNWMASTPRLVLVTNPRNGKSIIAAALESGPAPWAGVDTARNNTPKEGWTNPQLDTPPQYTGRVSGLPPTAIQALDAKMGMSDGTGDNLIYSWAPDQTAIPGPITLTAAAPGTSPDVCGTATNGNLNGVTFISQRDKRWDGQMLCIGAGHDRYCFTVHDEGCWATSVAMIISTFKGSLVTPMQTEGSGQPPENFSNNNLYDSGYIDMTASNLNRALQAVQSGSLVMAGGHYGVPWYNTSQHWEVIRGVTSDGKVLLNDPWDLPDDTDGGLPQKTVGYIKYDGYSQYNSAHSYQAWPQSDLLAHGFYLRIISKTKKVPGA